MTPPIQQTANTRRKQPRRWLATSVMLLSTLSVGMPTADAFTPTTDNLQPTQPRRSRPFVSKAASSSVDMGVSPLDSPSPKTPISITTSAERKLRQSISRKSRKQELLSLPSTSFSPNCMVSVSRRNSNKSTTSNLLSPNKLVSNSDVGTVGDKDKPSPKRRQDLLSRDEEHQLSKNVVDLQNALNVKNELKTMVQSEKLQEKSWADACGLTVVQLRRVLYEGQEARSTLVSANVGLVTSLAKRYHKSLKYATEAGGGVGTILSLQDMIQEGNLGLMHAAGKFDSSRGLKFSTYATYWVRQRILRSISEYSRIIRLPAHVHATLSKISKARKAMREEIGREPSDPELAHYLEMSVEKLRKHTKSTRNVVSLERPVRSSGIKDDRRTIGDFIASDAPTPAEDALRQYLKDDIRTVIGGLAVPEREVLVLRFGLENGSSLSIDQTAQQLGMTRDGVRLTEARALNKLRNPQRNYRLKDYVGIVRAEEEEETKQDAEEQTVPTPENLWFF